MNFIAKNNLAHKINIIDSHSVKLLNEPFVFSVIASLELLGELKFTGMKMQIFFHYFGATNLVVYPTLVIVDEEMLLDRSQHCLELFLD